MKRRVPQVIALCVFCCFLNACMTYKVVQIFQATSVVEGFFDALNSGEIKIAVGFYADTMRQSVGDAVLEEGLRGDAERFGAFVDYKTRSWRLEEGGNEQKRLVLICEVVYEQGITHEVFVISVGGAEKILSHEIKSERFTGGKFEI